VIGKAINSTGAIGRSEQTSVNSALNLSKGAISAWVKIPASISDLEAVVVKQFAYGIFINSDKPAFYDWTGSTLYESTDLVDIGEWNHLVLNFDSGITNGTTLYLNKKLIVTGTITVQSQLFPLCLTNAQTGIIFQNLSDGSVDDVRIYDDVLPESSINYLYGLRYGTGKYNGRGKLPVRYYDFPKEPTVKDPIPAEETIVEKVVNFQELWNSVTLLILISLSCATYPNVTYDIQMVVETRKDAPEYCSVLTHSNARACAKFNVYEYRPKQCRIIITPDDAHNRLDVLGHELLHCMIGTWH
jgi:hypothetical protein